MASKKLLHIVSILYTQGKLPVKINLNYLQESKNTYIYKFMYTALISAVNLYLANMDAGKLNGTVFIDLKKAFDTVTLNVERVNVPFFSVEHIFKAHSPCKIFEIS